MANEVLQLGDRAPAFTLPADDGERIKLTDYRGRWVVLYFYPRNFSPTCTQQACDFRDRHESFLAAGAVVIGISPDPVERHARFREEMDLDHLLLHDRDARVATRYGVWRERKAAGRSYVGLVRATMLLDPSGRIVQIWDNVRVRGHVDKVLLGLRQELGR